MLTRMMMVVVIRICNSRDILTHEQSGKEESIQFARPFCPFWPFCHCAYCQSLPLSDSKPAIFSRTKSSLSNILNHSFLYRSWWYIISGSQEVFALQPNMNLIQTCTWESFVNTRNSIHKSTQFLLERPKHLLVYPGFCLRVGIVSWFFGGCLAMAYQAVREGGGGC